MPKRTKEQPQAEQIGVSILYTSFLSRLDREESAIFDINRKPMLLKQ
jgi:hypothetical protein